VAKVGGLWLLPFLWYWLCFKSSRKPMILKDYRIQGSYAPSSAGNTLRGRAGNTSFFFVSLLK